MKRNDGVSMITLIITIIVIIILAAIAFVGMDDATGSAQYAKFSSEFGDYATNFTGSGSGETGGDPAVLAAIKVGDYVEYTPNETEVTANWGGLPTSITYTKGTPTEWRVWAIEGNNVVIMPTSPVGSLTLGEDNNKQKCYDDWKNAEEIINKVCKIYTNKALGVTESSIRSLTIEDLEKVGENLASDKANYLANNSYARESYTYQAGDCVAAYYNGSKNVINNQTNVEDIIAPTGENRTVKNTYYYSSNPGWKTLIKDTEGEETQVSEKEEKTEVRVKYRAAAGGSIEPNSFGELLGYDWSWLASSCVNCRSSFAAFFVHIAGGGYVYADFLLGSYGYAGSYSYGVRPLVSLSSMVLEGEGDSSYFATWTIKN